MNSLVMDNMSVFGESEQLSFQPLVVMRKLGFDSLYQARLGIKLIELVFQASSSASTSSSRLTYRVTLSKTCPCARAQWRLNLRRRSYLREAKYEPFQKHPKTRRSAKSTNPG